MCLAIALVCLPLFFSLPPTEACFRIRHPKSFSISTWTGSLSLMEMQWKVPEEIWEDPYCRANDACARSQLTGSSNICPLRPGAESLSSSVHRQDFEFSLVTADLHVPASMEDVSLTCLERVPPSTPLSPSHPPTPPHPGVEAGAGGRWLEQPAEGARGGGEGRERKEGRKERERKKRRGTILSRPSRSQQALALNLGTLGPRSARLAGIH